MSLTDDDPFGPGQCVPFVDEIMRHPHWQLQVGEAWWGCIDAGFLNVFTFSDGPDLAWEAWGMPTRRLTLTAAERETLRSAWRLSCDDLSAVQGDRFGVLVASIGDLRAGSAKRTMSGAWIVLESPMGAAFLRVFAAARDRYVAARRAHLGAVHAEFEVTEPSEFRPRARYHATLTDRHLVVRRGNRVRARVDLTDAELVDIADWALAQRDAPVQVDGEEARGYIDVNGQRASVDGYDRRWHTLHSLMDPVLDVFWTDATDAARRRAHGVRGP
ncbi:MAG: hypothetical protein K8W52_30465 [Deltaproteobacteria bacterium]|nr:hypothetical protein [Deltaproteobacteria bacterium]